MFDQHNPILSEIQQGMSAKFKVGYIDENGQPQEATTSLGQLFVPPSADKVRRDILASQRPKQAKKRRGFWQL